jgi:ATP-dependent Clp protease ATP-binding subunit ClpA
LIDQLTVDLTNRAKDGSYEYIVGRDPDIYRLTQILSRRLHNNPMIVGQPGTGKTSIVYGLAQKIIRGEAPPVLFGKKILALDLFGLVAGPSVTS